jgi:hypothetical protein
MFAAKVAKPQKKTIASSTNSLARQRSAFVAHPPSHDALEQAHILQRSIGNQATLRLLAQRGFSPTEGKVGGDHEQEAHTASPTVQAAKLGLSWDFSKIPIFPPERPNRPHAPSPIMARPLTGVMQAKLAIGSVDDPLEHEADRVADQVMRMPDPALSIASASVQLSRKCAACEEEEKAKKLKTKPAGSAEPAAGAAPPIVDEALRAPGQPLDQATRAFFEPRFRYDLSQVRVHTDEKAAASARAVGALAYTVGPHIAFAANRFAPSSDRGRHLIAHELAHVVQQSQGASVPLQRWTYEDSCSNFLDILLEADELAKDKVQKAIAALSISPLAPQIEKALFDYFRISASNPNKADLIAAILGVYRQIFSHFDAGDVDYECNCNDCPNPSSDLGCTLQGKGPIVLCIANAERVGGYSDIIVHELSHRYAGTDDFSYCEPTCADLTPDKAIGNASSYKYFAFEAWLLAQSPSAPAPQPTPAPN